VRLWPRVKSNAGSPDVERCKHVKSQATTVYFSTAARYRQDSWASSAKKIRPLEKKLGRKPANPQIIRKSGV
jgi:hypothetical protein